MLELQTKVSPLDLKVDLNIQLLRIHWIFFNEMIQFIIFSYRHVFVCACAHAHVYSCQVFISQLLDVTLHNSDF